MNRMYDEDWNWLYKHSTLPSPLGVALRMDDEYRQIEFVRAFAQDLRLPRGPIRDDEDVALTTWLVLDRLLRYVAIVVADGDIHAEGRTVGVAQLAVENLGRETAITALTQLGWRKERVRSSAVEDLDIALRTLLAQRLAQRLDHLLRFWANKGRIPNVVPAPPVAPQRRQRNRTRRSVRPAA